MNKVDTHFFMSLKKASELYFIGGASESDLDRAQKIIDSCAIYFSSRTPDKRKLIDDEIKEELIRYVMSRAKSHYTDNINISLIEDWIRGYFSLFEDPSQDH